MLAAAGCSTTAPRPVLLSLPPATAVAITAAPAVPPSSEAASSSASAPAPVAPLPMLAVRRVAIPEYLESRRVRYRADASTLAEWPNTYWAERIEIGVSRHFVSALRGLLPAWSVCESGCSDQPARLGLQVDLAPLDFERAEHRLTARARVTISSAGAPARVLQIRELAYQLPVPGDTPQAHAQAIGDVLAMLAKDVAPMVASQR